SPHGACIKCGGLGHINEIDIAKIIPDTSISIKKGGIKPLGTYKNTLIFNYLDAIAHRYNFDLDIPISEIPQDAMNVILYGTNEMLHLYSSTLGVSSNYSINFDGISSYLMRMKDSDNAADASGTRYDDILSKIPCPECNGTRLKKEVLYFKIIDKNIADLSAMDIETLHTWIQELPEKLNEKERAIATEIIKEIEKRLRFLLDVGLNYLSLNRGSYTLSGGESQRIRLATQIGSQLVNVLYILDEPSIGLHQRDNVKLIETLKKLRDACNTVIVVEHDKDMIMAADHVIDIGPGAGSHGGHIVAQGKPQEIVNSQSITSKYLTGEYCIPFNKTPRAGNGKFLKLYGATGHNLKNVNLTIPLGIFVCVTGVSGSGKSSLINQTLHPILNKYFFRAIAEPLPYKKIEGLENINKVIEVDQSPLGRTPRSNPATYTKVFDEIRKLFEITPEAKIRGYTAGRFSFNVKGGRCETCKGAGVKTIEMNFLPDVYVTCDACNGRRYNRETLEIRYKGKSISEVLDMTIEQALDFFDSIQHIRIKLKTLHEVGLGYVRLGQPSTTLSGGEAQRVKLASELAKRDTGNTLYILDEPTTGLHFHDVKVLLDVINKLTDKGNTIVVIEHNIDVIKASDYIIDLGPEGGRNGGEIVCEGTPEKIIKNKYSYTAQFLKKELK
ncbi:MAG: excinuclease ABC subunit UvrA, partial [Bacteroidales bacterium]